MIRYIFILLSVLLLLTINSCKKSDAVDIEVESEILKEMEAQKIRAVVACVVKDDKIVWEGTFGYANVNDSIQVTRQSLFTLMSISKLFLATTVMQLWERGMIDLDADINQYLPFDVRNPRFPDQRITPYMLLTHTSGLAWPVEEDRIPDFHHFYTLEEPPSIKDWLPDYILLGGSQYRASVWKEFPPGEKWLYSNIGTSLLALIVEEISGKDYRDFCRENILDPLEMHNSAFRLSDLNNELLVTPYTDNNNPMNYYTCRHYPVGFLSSNIEDFSHFVIANMNDGEFNGKRILQRSTFEKMLEIQNPASGVSFLWWWSCMGNCIGHKGGGTGFSTWVEWHFDDDGALFIFSNKVNESIYPGGRIYDLVRYQYGKF
jgi:CubicO group peptidase (beta-lactamase class C family)